MFETSPSKGLKKKQLLQIQLSVIIKVTIYLSGLSVRPGSRRSSGGYSLANRCLYSCNNVLMESNEKELHPIKWLVIIVHRKKRFEIHLVTKIRNMT